MDHARSIGDYDLKAPVTKKADIREGETYALLSMVSKGRPSSAGARRCRVVRIYRDPMFADGVAVTWEPVDHTPFASHRVMSLTAFHAQVRAAEKWAESPETKP